MNGKRLVDVLAESYDVRDRFLCISGNLEGSILFWDTKDEDILTFQSDGRKVDLAFSYGGANSNKWVIIKS